MIKKVKEEDLNKIDLFIGNEYYKCLYLYLDMKKYGITDENVKIWTQLDEKNKIITVILKYYSGMHIFSKNIKHKINEIIDLIKNEKPTMICGEKGIIKEISLNLDDERYESEYGYVRKLSTLKVKRSEEVKPAEEQDFIEIAKLLYEDEDIGSSYQLKELADQMLTRLKEGYARNYIIRKDNKAVAHAGTGAEYKNISVMSYVVTNKEFRKMGLATKVCATLCQDLLAEGKDVYLINYSNESTKLYDKLGFEVCCEWGKLFINLKKEENQK